MKRTIISAWNGIVNIGSESILKVTLEQLESRIDREKITVLSWSPEFTRNNYNVKSISHFSFLKEFGEDVRSNNYILGGGDLINELGKGMLFWMGKAGISKVGGCNLSVFSVGARPIESSLGGFFARKVLETADSISLRDKYSLKELEKIGLEDLTLTADPAFLLKGSDDEKANEIMEKYGIDSEKEIIGISLRHWLRLRRKYSPLKFYSPERLLKEMSEACERLAKKDREIVFLPTQIAPFADDREIGKALDRRTNEKIKIIDELIPPETMVGLISNFSCLISMRFHGIIFASLADTPCIGISYEYAPRVKRIMREFGLGDYTINLKEIESEKITEKVDSCLEFEEEIKRKMREKKIDMKMRAKKGFEDLKQNLE